MSPGFISDSSSSGGGVVGVVVGFGVVVDGDGVVIEGDGVVPDGCGVVAVGLGEDIDGDGVLVVLGEVPPEEGVLTAAVVVAPASSPVGEHPVIPIVAASSTAAALNPRPLVIV